MVVVEMSLEQQVEMISSSKIDIVYMWSKCNVLKLTGGEDQGQT